MPREPTAEYQRYLPANWSPPVSRLAAFIKSRKFLYTSLVLVVAAFALAACTAGVNSTAGAPQDLQTKNVPVEGSGSYTGVSAAGLATMLKNKDFPLINVHTPYAGEIEGTDLFVPYNAVEANLDKLPTNKRARLVVYCRSGSMSAIAARALVKLGYTDVWDLSGGMIAWQDAGYPLLDKGR